MMRLSRPASSGSGGHLSGGQLTQTAAGADRRAGPDADAGGGDAGELVERLDVIGRLDAAIGPLKQRRRGHTAGEVLVGIAAAQLAAAAGNGDPALDEYLKLDWLRARILDLPRDDRWQSLARAALREDLHVVHSAIAAEVLRNSTPGARGHEQVAGWVETIEAATNRCLRLLSDIINSGRVDLATISVALREIRSLVQASTPETVSSG